MQTEKKGEAQYQPIIEMMRERQEHMGLASGWAWFDDPKRLAFTFARYKFVAKMLHGRERVLEGGCGDGYFSRVVRQSVGSLVAADFDPSFIEDAKARQSDRYPIDFRTQDLLEGSVEGSFDAIYSMDVIEHIPASHEDCFISNLIAPLEPHGVVIIGAPSLESQNYASPQSKEGHINCKSQEDFREMMLKHFHTVFMFSMNDEVIHTGFGKMAHYSIALCCEKK